MKVVASLVLVVAVLTVAITMAQVHPPNTRPSRLGERSGQVGPIVKRQMKHDISPAVRDMEVAIANDGGADVGESDTDAERPQLFSRKGAAATLVDSALQHSFAGLVQTTVGVNVEGQVATPASWLQPDANGAVGATQYVQWVNVTFAVYSKTTGALIKGPVAGNTLWKGFGGACETTNSGDPIAQYDKAAGRWVMSKHAAVGSGPYYQCVAVSTTSDATGTFYRYSFPISNDDPDYPKLAVWPDAYYLSSDIVKLNPFSHVGPSLCALDRRSMLIGAPATAQCFQLGSNYLSLLPSDLDGPTAPPVGSPNYIVGLGVNSLNVWRFHVDFTNRLNTTLTGPTNIPVAPFSRACYGGECVQQPGTSQKLNTLGDRLMYRLAYRNFGDHESMVVNHSVNAGSSVGVRWYEIRSPGTNPFIYQQGTFAPDSGYRWMGSIAMDKRGDIALGYSLSSSSRYPSICYTGRVPTDPLGTLEGERTIISGTAVQPSVDGWGDYTAMSIDPVDDCTFWYTNQYLIANGSKNWRTHIFSIKFNSCQ